MAREFAQVRLSLWGDDEFRKLSPAAQHLYFVLLTSPTLSNCGVGDWRPKRTAALAGGWTCADVQVAADELVAALYIVVDEDTDEVLIRSFLRNDTILRQPRMAVAVARSHDTIASPTLRAVIVWELRRLREEFPEWKCWGTEATELLAKDAVDPTTYPLGKGSGKGSVNGLFEGFGEGSTNPSTNPSGKGSVKGSENPLATPSGKGSKKECPTTATATGNTQREELRSSLGGELAFAAPHAEPDSRSSSDAASGEPDTATASKRKKPARRLPADWAPTDKHHDYARQHHLDVEHEAYRFRNHAAQNDRTAVDWNAAFRNWLAKALEYRPHGGTNGYPSHTHLDAKTGRAVER